MTKHACSVIVITVVLSCKTGQTNKSTYTTHEQLLTGYTWKADEIRVQVGDNRKTFYKRGSDANTVNSDSDSLKFNSDNTGTYYYHGEEYRTEWKFTNFEKTKMYLTIFQGSAVRVYIENIHLTKDYFKYSQYSSSGGTSYLASGTRIPN